MSLPMLFCNIELKIYIPDGLAGTKLSYILIRIIRLYYNIHFQNIFTSIITFHFNIGFMDALSDPKGYLSAQEKEQAKRAEALAKIGIDETEIDTTNVIQSKGMYIYRSI